MNYSDRLRQNAELAKNKIDEPSSAEKSKQLKQSKKKLKSSIEEIFGKGKRLPVFSVITIDSEPVKKN